MYVLISIEKVSNPPSPLVCLYSCCTYTCSYPQLAELYNPENGALIASKAKINVV